MEYKALLHDTSIRLLEVQQGKPEDILLCKTIDALVDPTAGIPYSAISYTWGDDAQRKNTIYVNGYKFLVTDNLCPALRRVRKSDRSVYVWVDAICINQDDEEEKGHQVKQMGAIYAGAEKVLIWLGESDRDIDSFMELADWVAQFRIRMPPTETVWELMRHRVVARRDSLGDADWKEHDQQIGLKKLMVKRWFNRVWVLQEVAMARAAKILCGEWEVPAQVVAMMPRLLDCHVNDHNRAVLDIMPRYRTSSWWSSRRSLALLISKYHKSAATLPRDRVYALLGLSDDASDPNRFYPCYQKTDSEVLSDTASFIAFGEMVEFSHLLPRVTIAELSSTAEMIYNILCWLLARDGACIRRALNLLIGRWNDNNLGDEATASLADKFTTFHLAGRPLIYPAMPVAFSIVFTDKGHVFQVEDALGERFGMTVTFPLKLPFHNDEKPSLGIRRLFKEGTPKEELLRAYAWMGDANGVKVMIEAGVDADTKYSDGRTAGDLLSLTDRYWAHVERLAK